MRILWLCNIKLPIVEETLGLPPSPFGGWLDQVSRKLVQDGHDVHLLFPHRKTVHGKGLGFSYTGFASIEVGKVFENTLDEFSPEVVHIWGTEYEHSLVMTEILECKGLSDIAVISIQGLVSKISQHYFTALPEKIIHGFTIRDLIKRENVYQSARKFKKRGESEVQAIKNVKHVIGRTEWDKACIEQINPDAHYHHCSETLRSAFYSSQWQLDKCDQFSIFVSQLYYPIKGFHILLQALPLIKEMFPGVIVRVAGFDLTYRNSSFRNRMKISFFGKYISKLIDEYGLKSSVEFMGTLNEKEMLDAYLRSHVFVSASTLENSPNSLGEAMLLGMPCVSSYVGGVPSLLRPNHEGFLYQADAPYMLAYYVTRIFRDAKLAVKMGENARQRALNTHDSERNMSALYEAYSMIVRK